jgi:preprotein translocase subunit SecD
MEDSDKPDVGLLVTSMGVILVIIGFVLVAVFVFVNPSIHPGTTPIQTQKVYAAVGLTILGLILTTVGAFISKRLLRNTRLR